MDLRGVRDDDILGQVRIERVRQPVTGNARGGPEIGDIHPRMDAGVRAAAAGHMHRMADDGGGSLFERLADGRDRLLHLPAVVGRAEILERQGNITHSFLPFYSPKCRSTIITASSAAPVRYATQSRV